MKTRITKINKMFFPESKLLFKWRPLPKIFTVKNDDTLEIHWVFNGCEEGYKTEKLANAYVNNFKNFGKKQILKLKITNEKGKAKTKRVAYTIIDGFFACMEPNAVVFPKSKVINGNLEHVVVTSVYSKNIEEFKTKISELLATPKANKTNFEMLKEMTKNALPENF